MTALNVKDIFNDLHQIPEVGFQEFKTSAYLADKLEALGYEVTRNLGGTGVVGIVKGAESGPVMWLLGCISVRYRICRLVSFRRQYIIRPVLLQI